MTFKSSFFQREENKISSFQDGSENPKLISDRDGVSSANQRRMRADPFETLLMNMGYEFRARGDDGDDDGGEDDDGEGGGGGGDEVMQCRQS